jgi:hypothetical protein
MRFLKEMTGEVLEASRIRPGESLLDLPGGKEIKIGSHIPLKNTTGVTLVRPGGWNCYPAFWIRDFAMSLESGLVPDDELLGMILLTASKQNGPEERVLVKACIPPFAVADHIRLDGEPVYFPGTYSSGDDQGGDFGYYPPYCDYYYFVEMVYRYVAQSKDDSILTREVAGYSVLERIERAFETPLTDPHTNLAWTSAQKRAVNFGFMDSIIQTGSLLFSSLLRYQAALMLSELLIRLNYTERSLYYQRIASQIREVVPIVFGDGSGWLMAATDISRQHDVWGTAFAVHIGLLQGSDRLAALEVLRDGYTAGRTCYRGNVRHIPCGDDYSSTSAWELTVNRPGPREKNRYQNGAYWGTPSGWYINSLSQIDMAMAERLFMEYTDELMSGDFRNSQGVGSPWECLHPDGDYRQNGIYLTSVAVPFASLMQFKLEADHGKGLMA